MQIHFQFQMKAEKPWECCYKNNLYKNYVYPKNNTYLYVKMCMYKYTNHTVGMKSYCHNTVTWLP